MMLGRWNFFDRQIFADIWIPRAGLSEVDHNVGAVWVWVYGVPVHLRSFSLFRAFGDACGTFLDHQEVGCSLNSVRIRVKLSGAIPCRIPVSFEGELFQVRVVVENSPNLLSAWQDSVNAVFVRTSDLRLGVRAPSPDAGASCFPSNLPLSPVGKSGACGSVPDRDNTLRPGSGTQEMVLVKQKVDVRREPTLERILKETDVQLSPPTVFDDRLQSVDGTGVEFPMSDSRELEVGTDGLSFGEISPLTMFPRLGSSLLVGPTATPPNGTTVGPGVGLSASPLSKNPNSGSPILGSSKLAQSFLEAARKGKSIQIDDSGPSSPYVRTVSPTPFIISAASPVRETVASTFPPRLDDFGLQGETSNGDEEVRLTCSLIAERMDLALDGSTLAASDFVQNTANAIISGRNNAKSRSRLERELRKIDIDGDFSSKGDRRSRRDMVVSSHLSTLYDC
ncbi:hypothetical protein LINGRAHAP2_LOCUS17376 [Linum grandiflorum]